MIEVSNNFYINPSAVASVEFKSNYQSWVVVMTNGNEYRLSSEEKDTIISYFK